MNDILRENPLVSIIIRTKNEEKWITLCLDALNKQSYKNFEIIIVDNYSNDKTIQKIKRNKTNFYPSAKFNIPHF